MSKAGYTVSTGAAVALAAATAKSVLMVVSPSQFGCDLKKWRVGFTGIDPTAVPVLVELCYSTQASNSVAGTGNTSATVLQGYGRTITPGFTAGYNATAEPTVLTVFESLLLTPAGGFVMNDYPLGDSPDSAVSNGFVLRCTAPAITNVRATMWFERT